ncbi:MAG: aspartate carbamoyltransferase [Christensenellaceae bacterium]|jgi:aspartate carbamoyltransferase catalytic subunit|nr:aspartate carbamoyltransferase [Christensenellaceae bacterium]
MTARCLIEPGDLSTDEILHLVRLAGSIIRQPERFATRCTGKLLASLFFEPSTRTKFSFDAAMLRLGGQVIGFSDPATSSSSKGETLADTARMVESYADLIVVRHPREGAPKHIANFVNCPVINAGDGGHQHPTQTLTDLLTISAHKGRLQDLTVGVCGDLMFGRTIHSLASTLARFPGIKLLFISPEELRMPQYVKDDLAQKGVPFEESTQLESVIGRLDILYMSRVQRERFVSEEEYLRLKDYFILTKEKLSLAKSDTIVMHPLPRVNEIAADVDSDPRALYFAQARYGMFIRMALILFLLGLEKEGDLA